MTAKSVGGGVEPDSIGGELDPNIVGDGAVPDSIGGGLEPGSIRLSKEIRRRAEFVEEVA